jgi:hypothetical protein
MELIEYYNVKKNNWQEFLNNTIEFRQHISLTELKKKSLIYYTYIIKEKNEEENHYFYLIDNTGYWYKEIKELNTRRIVGILLFSTTSRDTLDSAIDMCFKQFEKYIINLSN